MNAIKSFAVVYCPNSEDMKYVGSVSDYIAGGMPDPVLMTEQEANDLVDELTKYVDEEQLGSTEMENKIAHDAFDAGEWGFKVEQDLTFDVQFDNDTMSNSKGFHSTYEECMEYIRANRGTSHNSYSYFADYKGGVVSIVCNETGETVYSEEVK